LSARRTSTSRRPSASAGSKGRCCADCGSGDFTRRGDQTLIRIDEVALTYSIRELFQQGVVIRSLRLTRPYVVGAKMPDGRWDLGALVKRDSREQTRTGPNRPIEIQSIEVIDGRISLQDPLDFGPAHVPTDFQQLNARFSFATHRSAGR